MAPLLAEVEATKVGRWEGAAEMARQNATVFALSDTAFPARLLCRQPGLSTWPLSATEHPSMNHCCLSLTTALCMRLKRALGPAKSLFPACNILQPWYTALEAMRYLLPDDQVREKVAGQSWQVCRCFKYGVCVCFVQGTHMLTPFWSV